MSLRAPPVSVFTFQSAVHSAHVLQCLNNQRQQDVLCDVTVEVEGRSFRAHCSVLASCSAYFQSRVTGVNDQNPVIALPNEVTVEGFEPLLQFAYTSTLLFTKENIHTIRSCAEFLGFHNLEQGCFDFLVPKFSESKAQEAAKRVCCPDSGSSAVPGAESVPPKSLDPQNSAPSGDDRTAFPPKCLQTPPGQMSNGTEHFCLENCGPQISPISLELAANSVCPMLSLAAPTANKAGPSSQLCEQDILEIGGICDQGELNLAHCGLPCELPPPGEVEATGREVQQAMEMLGVENECDLAPCAEDCRDLLGQGGAGLERRTSKPTLTDLNREEGLGERSSVEREVAEHLAKGFWSDLCPPQNQPLPLYPADQSNLAKPSDFHWLKQLDLSSNPGDCPFLRDLGAGDEPAQPVDGLSQSEKSPCMSSSLNSGDDSDLDTDGDAEANKRRAAEIQLQFPVEQISTLSRSAFQQLLKQHQLTPDQLEFVHDVRRRSKNRAAAQRCRKRKLESIHQLDREIKVLKGEKERLLQERTELEQNLEETRHSLFRLCKSVSMEPGTEEDQLQLLAKLSSPDLAGHQEEEPEASGDGGSRRQNDPKSPAASGRAASPPVEASSSYPQSCSVTSALLNACLDMNNIL